MDSIELSVEQRSELLGLFEGQQERMRSVLGGSDATVELLLSGDSSLTPLVPHPEDPSATVVPELKLPENRYKDKGVLGRGGMGVVRRVLDRDLGRKVAMKVIRRDRIEIPGVLVRFVREAQATAQLEHPGIVPIYDIGRLEDGRIFFTQRVVEGVSLSDLIQEVHLASTGDQWLASRGGWTLRKLIDAMHKVCETMAYAHARDTIHRDLKPDNVMLGAFGEVLVMDWGLVKMLGEAGFDPPDDEDYDDEEQALSTSGDETQYGMVTGTPSYMPPEQARGEIDNLGPHSDVYALGAMLYKVLTGRSPYHGKHMLQVLRKVDKGPPPPPSECVSLPLPPQLEEICLKAMGREPEDRYSHAGLMAAELAAWLEGARARDEALALVKRADDVNAEIRQIKQQAVDLAIEAERLSSFVLPHEESEDKADVWILEDQAQETLDRLELKQVEYLQLLQNALSAADVVDAHERLAKHYRGYHERAEEAGNRRECARYEALLRAHDTGEHREYLAGTGTLSLESNCPGVVAELYKYEERDRLLVQKLVRKLGPLPLHAEQLEMGSYMVVLRADNHAQIHYPVHIRRQEHWAGIRYRGAKPYKIELPLDGALAPGEIYIPGGFFRSGGDRDAVESLPAAMDWVEPFAICEFCVTNGEYLAFLNELIRTGYRTDALQYAPHDRSSAGHAGELLYGQDPRGYFTLPEGRGWKLDTPVVMVTYHDAEAYAQWLSQREGKHWRLPTEAEWEKAARGVDARVFPCGDFLDPSWSCTRGSHADIPSVASVASFPKDCSPYGVRGMAGNVSEWSADLFEQKALDGDTTQFSRVGTDEVLETMDHQQRAVRGGNWNAARRNARCASRMGLDGSLVSPILGFRLCRTL